MSEAAAPVPTTSPNPDHVLRLAAELNVKVFQVAATAQLFAEGATVPFIARYRKEATGELDEVQVLAIRDRLEQMRAIDDRRAAILASLKERNLLTPALEKIILAADTLRPADEVEDKAQLYEARNEALRSEAYARSLKEDPKSLEADEDLEALLRSVAAEGFDRAAAATKGKVNEAVQGLRFWARTLLLELCGEGSPHLAYRLDPNRLLTLADGTLATMLALADARSGGLAWLREGDAGDTGADQPDDD